MQNQDSRHQPTPSFHPQSKHENQGAQTAHHNSQIHTETKELVSEAK